MEVYTVHELVVVCYGLGLSNHYTLSTNLTFTSDRITGAVVVHNHHNVVVIPCGHTEIVFDVRHRISSVRQLTLQD